MTPKDILSLIAREKGLSINALAKKIDIDRGSLNNLMQGKTKKISYNVASHIVAAFPEYRLEWLLTGDGDPKYDAPIQNISGGVSGVVINGNNTNCANTTPPDKDILQQLTTLKECCARLEGENKALRETIAILREMLNHK